MMMSGSWRRNARSATGNVSPAFSFMLTWFTPASWISAGSSAVEMLTPRLVQDVEARVERHGLAAAGGAGDEDQPVRPPDRVHQRLLLVGLVAQRLDAELDARRVEDTHHDLLAEERRQRADAEIDRLDFDSTIFIRPSCGTRFSEMSSLEITLIRDASLSLITSGGCATSIRMPSRPVADAVELFVRLEVDVRDAGLNRVDQDLLQVADDRRVLDLGAFLVAAPAGAVGLLEVDLQVLHADAASFSSAPDASTSLWIDAASLSFSTTTGSTTRFVLNRISSRPCRFAGSDVAT